MSNIKDTILGVYIIESLDISDERRNISEGKMIKKALQLCGVKCSYKYIRTETEFRYFLSCFRRSKYRYLHISCHGSKTSLCTTLDTISQNALCDLLPKNIDNRRIFISACGFVNDNIAKNLLGCSDCFSVIGYDEDVNICDSAMLWSSFYYAIFRQHMQLKERFRMNRNQILLILKGLTKIYEQIVNYYAYKRNELVKCIIDNGKTTEQSL
ncbi:MAG: hypothetical protein J5976_00085 [Bacteroidales bacterium]|nr:hypothetical protein [Bacteroidales bacterium]